MPSATRRPSNGWISARHSVSWISSTRRKRRVDIRREFDLGAVEAALRDPERIGARRHDHFGAGAEATRGVGGRDRVITGADRADAARALGLAQSSSMFRSAPRALKLPVRWNSSSFRCGRVPGANAASTVGPASGWTGVVSTRSPSCRRASRISASVSRGSGIRVRNHGPAWYRIGRRRCPPQRLIAPQHDQSLQAGSVTH